jgi:1-phosphofructokinase family hexose kinase
VTLVICPNLAVDRILATDAVRPGGMSRCRELRTQAGGKGANVARATRALGGCATLAGFAGGRTGLLIVELAEAEGLELHAVPVAGEARVSTVVLGGDGSVTRLYETGPEVTVEDEDRLLELTGRHTANAGEWAVITGAAPPGVSPDFYARLLTAARSRGYRVLVDATGEQLVPALAAGPDLVKINLAEACDAVGDAGLHCNDEKSDGRARLVREGVALARRLCDTGAAGAVLTLGPAGAAGVLDGAARQVATPAVRAVNPVGSGDCFAAALTLALQRGEDGDAALRLAAGAGAANAASPYNGEVDPAMAARLAGGAAAGPPAHA